MRQPPIRIRTFILGTFLVLLLVPTLAGGAAWLIERDHQQATVKQRLNTTLAYLTSHRNEMREPASVQGFTRLLNRFDMLAQVVLVTTTPPGKSQLYLSPALNLGHPTQKQQAAKAKAPLSGTRPPNAPSEPAATWPDNRRLIAAGTAQSRATLVTDIFHRPVSRSTRALAALVSGLLVLLTGLTVAVWLAGRWMVAPLAKLSAQVDKVAGGDLTIEVPRSRIGEIANIAQAVEGMTAAMGETAQRRAQADEARGFLVTSIAHDLRTPLFALRGHLQAVGSQLGDRVVHLERAEARADALERLIGNLFAYVRDDYAQPAPRLEAAPLADILGEAIAGLEHAARLRDNTFVLHGDQGLVVIVDRDRFKRALTNILDNALRYSPPGAPIELSSAAVDESTVQLVAHDRGPGIDPNLLPHIFEPGIRGTPAVGNTDSGSGLGLTIAKRLLEHQNATLTIESNSTDGTIVSLVLQRAPTASPP